MGTLTPHVEAAMQSGMLVGVNQAHAFNYPEHDVVKHLAEFTEGRYILYLVKAFKPSLLLTRHLSRRNIEFGKTNVFNSSLDTINGCGPTKNNGSTEVAFHGTAHRLFQVRVFIGRKSLKECR